MKLTRTQAHNAKHGFDIKTTHMKAEALRDAIQAKYPDAAVQIWQSEEVATGRQSILVTTKHY